jgi:hypothetical protein
MINKGVSVEKVTVCKDWEQGIEGYPFSYECTLFFNDGNQITFDMDPIDFPDGLNLEDETYQRGIYEWIDDSWNQTEYWGGEG